MEKKEFDEMIQLLQNETRRRILDLLSKEENYPLAISRNLDTSQQSVSKHLDRLEDKGLVISKKCKSEKGGPPTKKYSLNREFSLRIDLGPQLFDTGIEDLRDEEIDDYEEIEEKVRGGIVEGGYLEGHRKIILNIERKIRKLERERKYLLKLKEKALSEAYNYIHENFDNYEERKILYYVLDSGVTDPREIAKYFNVREDEIKRILEDMKEKTKIW
ncbi:MAG: ArsR family transcriptional regulator [Candidatus Thermoplasmatota archaeon]|nr:ArsR family transcriptional regulator [Candidatus Thermoplasmatota archaeon]MBS3790814.1 ArsR family transcriptional regulator [Candidatus Thermoplasmatota archaeon]